MDKLLVDLNVILDFLLDRKEAEAAEKIMDAVQQHKVKGMICAHELCTLSYFLEKNGDRPHRIKHIINDFSKLFSVITLTPRLIQQACASSLNDFEDAVIAASAEETGCNWIVTSNIKDFRLAEIPAITASNYVKKMRKK